MFLLLLFDECPARLRLFYTPEAAYGYEHVHHSRVMTRRASGTETVIKLQGISTYELGRLVNAESLVVAGPTFGRPVS